MVIRETTFREAAAAPMIHFAHPAFLLLALAVPPVIWWWVRQRRGALRYPSTGLFAGLPAGSSRLARWAGAGGRALALLLGVVALAGPRWPDTGSRLPTEGIAIEMIVDVSGSMGQADFQWEGRPITRLDAVKRAFRLFVQGGPAGDGQRLEGRPDDLIGLVTFATLPESPCPLTLSHSVLLQMLDAAEPKVVPTECQTNIGDAITWGLLRLEAARGRRRIMVLLSDGEHNVPPPALKPRPAAQFAANEGIPIYTIDAGGDVSTGEGPAALPAATGETVATQAELRADGIRTLKNIAELTGGQYFRARDTETLLAVCQKIDGLERQKIESFRYRRYYEGFAWAALASFVLLVGVYFLEVTWWLRVP
jgi:Ca-activated chloride channel family protein